MLTEIISSWHPILLGRPAEPGRILHVDDVLDLDAGRGKASAILSPQSLHEIAGNDDRAAPPAAVIHSPTPSDDRRAAPPAPRDDPSRPKCAPARAYAADAPVISVTRSVTIECS